MALRSTSRSASPTRSAWSVVAMLLVLLFSATAATGAAEIELALSGVPKNAFGGAEIAAAVRVNGAVEPGSRLLWSLDAIDHRALLRGEAQLEADAPIRVRLPPVKDGIVLPLMFRASLFAASSSKPTATVERKVRLYPESPWADKQELLESRKITLFDPVGETAKLLTAASVPFEQQHNLGELNDLGAGLLLVGEGLDFREHRELPTILRNRAAHGCTVICLAPAAGSWPLQPEESRDLASGLRFRRADAITELDPELDAGFWEQDRKKLVAGFALRGEGSTPILEVGDDAAAWPWIETRFDARGGKLIHCGFRFLPNWNDHPAPRYLLFQLLTSDFAPHAPNLESQGPKSP